MTQNILQLPYTSQEILSILSKANTSNQDGNWVQKYLGIDGLNQVDTTTEIVEFRNYLPNDSSWYEILVTGYSHAKSSSGDYANLYLSTENSQYYYGIAGACYVNSNNSLDSMSTAIVLISPSHKLFLGSNDYANKGTFVLRIHGYKKINVEVIQS